MELGEKLRQARLEAGLSQRQLCGEEITRNMLSLIENGAARPSMETLRYLSSRLGKPVSFFLEEDGAVSVNQRVMDGARAAFRAGDFARARTLLEGFQQPDPVYQWEYGYLKAVSALAAAQQAILAEKWIYARELLTEAEHFGSEIPELRRRRLLLLGRLPDADLGSLSDALPDLDEELFLRAAAALTRDDPGRAESLLAAAQERTSPRWNYLMGRALLLQKRYAAAAACLKQAEIACPAQCWKLLETCYRELGDFENAYFYACKQK